MRVAILSTMCGLPEARPAKACVASDCTKGHTVASLAINGAMPPHAAIAIWFEGWLFTKVFYSCSACFHAGLKCGLLEDRLKERIPLTSLSRSERRDFPLRALLRQRQHALGLLVECRHRAG